MATHQAQPSHWRRQSTLILSPTKFDGSLAPDSPQSSLKPPSTSPTNSERNSFGFWSGSKSAASTPNLGNTVGTNHTNGHQEVTSSSLTVDSEALGQGSGELSAGSVDSSSSSFSQRRKRSESTGGLKHTAGNITKIVKKSSSNFLKKFVKNFDDKDAPPTPVTPASNSSSVRSLPHVSRQVTVPDLPPVAPPHGHQNRIGPLDTPPPLSPLLGQELENHFSTIDSSMPDVKSQLQQPMHGPSVESWLDSTNQGLSSNGYQANFVSRSGESTPLDRRRSKVADTLNDLDDDEEVDEDEDEDLPADISNRLSKLYESSSIHPNQSQTSLYYSTKSSLSDSEAADSGSRRTSLAQDALGYSLGLSRGSSIRFSQYSLGSLHLAPLTGSASTPSSPNKNPMEYIEGRATPRRPATMFIPLSGGADNGTSGEDGVKTDRTRTARAYSEVSHTASNAVPPTPATLLTPIVTREAPRLAGTRPVTICVSPQDTTIPPSSNLSAIMMPATTTEDQPETTAAAAFQNAKRCFDEDESFLKRGEIAEYLGAPKPFNRLVLKHYMDHFDFAGKRLDMAFRVLCQKLVLKGETQEVDRILEVFAERYVTCNPRSLLGGADHSKDVVHAITYSILLLNTDLHIVQQSSKMSKSAFIKNTLQAVQSQSQQASSGDDSASTLTGNSSLGLPLTITGDSMYGSLTSSKKRPPSVKSWKSGQSHQSGIGQILSGHYYGHSSKMGTDAKANGGYGNGKWWQQELESLLKDVYSSVKQHQILLPTSSTNLSPPGSRSHGKISSPPTSPTTSGFGSSFFSSNRMSRLISSSSHDSGSGSSGFGLGFSGGRRNSVSARTKQLRSEAIQRLNAQAQSQPSGIETEHLTRSAPLPMSFNPLNVRHSVAGPLLSESFLLDYTSNSNIGSSKDRDLGRGVLRSGEDQSQYSSSSRLSSLTLATSQAAMSNASTVTTTPSASQNSLTSLQSYSTSIPTSAEDCQKKQALAQFQKDQLHQQHIQTRYRMEGILWRKHLLERTDKKAQHRAWRQLLVVVDPDHGTLSMFRSDGSLPKAQPSTYHQPHGSTSSLPTSSSLPLGDRDADMPLFDEIPLQHTITNILPPPGYSSSRRHVFAVQLHTGAVYLFQTTSPQECEAWARTCNYWAARTSKEPLLGGVVNMEYGWGRALDLLARQEEEQRNQAMGGQEGGRMTPASDLSQSSITTRSVTSINTRVALDYSPAPTDYLGEALGLGFNPTSSAASGGVRTPSVRSGTRGSFSSASGVLPGNSSTATSTGGGTGGVHGSLGDSISLFEWTAPMPTMTASKLTEEDQMLALRKYVASLESDMEVHQDHRLPMTRLFMPKTSNHTKAFNNWERRSRYLLKEMVKYQIYVECLEQSLQVQKLQDMQHENHERGGGLLRTELRTEDDLEAELAKLIVHEGPHA